MREGRMERAVRMAYRLLLRHGDGHLPVQPLDMLHRCRDTAVYTIEETEKVLGMPVELERGLQAMTYVFQMEDRTWRIVCYRTDGNMARMRYSLAHELGHIVLGHTRTDDCSERQADLFASHLLCPRPVIELLKEQGVLYAEQLETLFFVSHSAMMHIIKEKRAFIEEDIRNQIIELYAPKLPNELPGGRILTSWHRFL